MCQLPGRIKWLNPVFAQLRAKQPQFFDLENCLRYKNSGVIAVGSIRNARAIRSTSQGSFGSEPTRQVDQKGKH